MCWASVKREPACRCCIAQWGCCQLGGKWELVGAEMGRMSWERGLQSTAPARRRGRCFTLRLKREEPKGLCSSPVTRCPVAAGWEGGRKEGQQLRAAAGWFGVAVNLSPSGAGGCPREEAVHVQETQQQDLAVLGLAQSQQCSGPRPLLETI